AVCWVASSTSPVVLRKTTASNRARLVALNWVASSVAVTVKLLAAPSSRIVWMPTAIESCRKPAVLENTSTSYGASAALAGGLDVQASMRVAAAATLRMERIRCRITRFLSGQGPALV